MEWIKWPLFWYGLLWHETGEDRENRGAQGTGSHFFEVTPRTVDNYIDKYGEELRQNGYEVLRDNRLKTLKLAFPGQGVNETDFISIKTFIVCVSENGKGKWIVSRLEIISSRRMRLLKWREAN